MILLSYFNKGNPVFALAEDNIGYIIGVIIRDFMDNHEACCEMFDSTIVTYEDNTIVAQPYDINILIKHKNVIQGIKETAKDYETAYVFDGEEMYIIQDDALVRLNNADYKLYTCSHCGKVCLENDKIDDYCIDCFLTYAMEKFLNASCDEQYTQYETLSKVQEKIAIIKHQTNYTILEEKIKLEIKDNLKKYLSKEKVPERLYDFILGGLAA